MLLGVIIVSAVLFYGLWVLVTIGGMGVSHTREFKHYRQHQRDRDARLLS